MQANAVSPHSLACFAKICCEICIILTTSVGAIRNRRRWREAGGRVCMKTERLPLRTTSLVLLTCEYLYVWRLYYMIKMRFTTQTLVNYSSSVLLSWVKNTHIQTHTQSLTTKHAQTHFPRISSECSFFSVEGTRIMLHSDSNIFRSRCASDTDDR